MATHPLVGTKLKLLRAEKHLETIIEVLQTLEHGQCELIPENQENFGFLRIRLSPKPPDDLSVIAGDCLFNMRSALDHIVWQLVLVNNGTPTNRHSFPISKNRKTFDEAVASHHRLDNIPAKAITVIENLQPYHAQETHPLALLSKLHNIDKHQKLNLITAVARDTELAWGNATADGAIQTAVTSFLGGEELCDGALMPFGVPLDFPEFPGVRERFEKAKVRGCASLFVAFEDRVLLDPDTVAREERNVLEPMYEHLRVDWVLEEIVRYIRETALPALEPFFS